MIALLSDPTVWAAFITLTILEVILGFDNLILITILADKLPREQQSRARRLGLITALVTRILLLSIAFFIAHLESNLFTVFDVAISWRDILLIAGGLFLLAKGTLEIHNKLETEEEREISLKKTTFAWVIMQIAIMDIVFSFDSVMTAIGVSEHLPVMVAAIVISIVMMLLAMDWIGNFISRHPTIKILALSYMLLIGLALMGEGLDMHIPKGYLYFAMAFSFFVEMINMGLRGKKKTPETEILD